MAYLLTLSDSVCEAVFCLGLHFYYGRRAKRSADKLRTLHQLCCTHRSILELHHVHKVGFRKDQLQCYIHKVHRYVAKCPSNFYFSIYYFIFSCLSCLENRLQRGRANLLGSDRSVADYAWAPIIHHLLHCGFPLGNYPYISMWYDIIEHSTVFGQAVKAWNRPMLSTWLDCNVCE